MWPRLEAVLLSIFAVVLRAADKPAQTQTEPQYDPATVIDAMAAVLEVREVPRNSPLPGIHLLVRLEAEAIDSYLGPADFVKQFDVAFLKNDRVQIIGSKVRFGNGTVVLLRELRKGSTTLYLRDRSGKPNWSTSEKPSS